VNRTDAGIVFAAKRGGRGAPGRAGILRGGGENAGGDLAGYHMLTLKEKKREMGYCIGRGEGGLQEAKGHGMLSAPIGERKEGKRSLLLSLGIEGGNENVRGGGSVAELVILAHPGKRIRPFREKRARNRQEYPLQNNTSR